MMWRSGALTRSRQAVSKHHFLPVIHQQPLATAIWSVTLPRISARNDYDRPIDDRSDLPAARQLDRRHARPQGRPDTRNTRWVAQVLALIEAGKLVDPMGIASFHVVSQHLQGPLRDANWSTIL